MGLSESSLSTIFKSFECLTHCKFTAKSPCCKACCGDESCERVIDTHQHGEHEHVEV